MAKIKSQIIPIGAVYASRLKSQGLNTWAEFLEKAAKPKDLKALEKQAKIDRKALADWANRARLVSVVGNRLGVLKLLNEAGISTTRQLKLRNPENLQVKLKEINAESEQVKRVPSLKQIKEWIAKAKGLKV